MYSKSISLLCYILSPILISSITHCIIFQRFLSIKNYYMKYDFSDFLANRGVADKTN